MRFPPVRPAPVRLPRLTRAARQAGRAPAGAALPTALLLLVALSALAGGGIALSRQSFRGGRNTMVEQRAFAVAEAGLNQQIGEWDPALNAVTGAGGVPVNTTVTASIFVANGDTADVRVTRLDPMLFWVQSFGRASIPNPQLQAMRTVGGLVRIAYASINPLGAITTNGDVDIQGNAFTADGRDRIPAPGGMTPWNPARCAGLTGADQHAIAVPPGAKVQFKDGNFAPGSLQVLYTPTAGDPNTYIAFGTETMNTLIQNADRRFDPGALPSSIAPSITVTPSPAGVVGATPDTVCRRTDPANWGEPNGARPLATERCQGFFPIVYISGSATLNGNGRGQGILIVDGDLQINGNFDWVGLVLVRNDMNKGNGNASITGAVMARNIDMKDASIWGGSQTVNYSKCAVESALRGSAILIRVRDRAWAQLF